MLCDLFEAFQDERTFNSGAFNLPRAQTLTVNRCVKGHCEDGRIMPQCSSGRSLKGALGSKFRMDAGIFNVFLFTMLTFAYLVVDGWPKCLGGRGHSVVGVASPAFCFLLLVHHTIFGSG